MSWNSKTGSSVTRGSHTVIRITRRQSESPRAWPYDARGLWVSLGYKGRAGRRDTGDSHGGGGRGGRPNPAGSSRDTDPGVLSDKMIGKEPEIFTGDRDKVEEFMTSWSIYYRINKQTRVMHNPKSRTMLFFGYLRGPKMHLWIKKISTQLCYNFPFFRPTTHRYVGLSSFFSPPSTHKGSCTFTCTFMIWSCWCDPILLPPALYDIYLALQYDLIYSLVWYTSQSHSYDH